MDIWHIIPTTNLGGNEVFARSLVKNFPIKANHTFFSASNIDGLIAKDIKLIANLKKIYIKNSIKSLISIFMIFRESRPNAIVIHTFNTSLIFFILIAKLFQIRKIIITVGNPPPKEFLFQLRIYLTFLRLFKVPLVFCSKFVLKQFRNKFFLPKNSIHIRNGCDLYDENLAEKIYKNKFSEKRKFKITMVSRLDKIKDQETLIKAFLSIKNNKWELNLVGDGETKDYLQDLVSSRGATNVRFLGSRNDVLRILSSTDIFAFSTTNKEGFGIVLIEALSLGIPIVASDVSACREVLMDGKGGILVNPGDLKDWEKVLSKLMNSESERKVFGKKAKEISKYYDIRIVAREYLRLLNKI